jgi:hypothetical protein
MQGNSIFKTITIRIPNYVTEVKVSNTRRAKYFKPGDTIPLKYQNDSYVWKAERLFDTVTKAPVIKNPIAMGKPRYQTIAGNEIYARMHERLRMLIVSAIKDNYREHMPKELDLNYPVAISMQVHTFPKYLNWDVDNLWIYIKCFQDLLVELKLIPDDDIRYIRTSGEINFTPVQDEEQRQLIFTIEELPIPTHVMYHLKPKEFNFYDLKMTGFKLTRTKDGTTGDVVADIDNQIFYLNVGKIKISENAVEKTLIKVFHYCIHYDIKAVSVSAAFHLHHKEQLGKQLLNRGILVRVFKSTI